MNTGLLFQHYITNQCNELQTSGLRPARARGIGLVIKLGFTIFFRKVHQGQRGSRVMNERCRGLGN